MHRVQKEICVEENVVHSRIDGGVLPRTSTACKKKVHFFVISFSVRKAREDVEGKFAREWITGLARSEKGSEKFPRLSPLSESVK